MDLATAALFIESLPRDFCTKDGQTLWLELLQANMHRSLVDAYLAFQPRNSFQGLPPPKDEVCVRWVEGMIQTGINVTAHGSDGGIAGHTALFPINDHKCEMLVVVWPRFQNIGIGTELTRTCEQMARELGFERIWLPVDSTNVRARHIYAKCGFENVSRQPSRELIMVYNVRPSITSEVDAGPKHAQPAVPHFDLGAIVAPAECPG
jgi:RimJ/RimL family protein N-acetyltransferase